MSLFGGTGFLGLGGTDFGNFFEGLGDTVGDITDFITDLPNNIIDFGVNLGEAQGDYLEESADTIAENRVEFESRRAGLNFGSSFEGILGGIFQNPLISMAAVAGIVYLITKD